MFSTDTANHDNYIGTVALSDLANGFLLGNLSTVPSPPSVTETINPV